MEQSLKYYYVCLTPLQYQSIKHYHERNKSMVESRSQLQIIPHQIQSINPNCFCPFTTWEPPTKNEISIIFQMTKLTQSKISSLLGLKDTNGRTFRRYLDGSVAIPYSTWVLMCDLIEIKDFWKPPNFSG